MCEKHMGDESNRKLFEGILGNVKEKQKNVKKCWQQEKDLINSYCTWQKKVWNDLWKLSKKVNLSSLGKT